MQKPKQRFLSAIVAVAMALSQFAPVTAYAADLATSGSTSQSEMVTDETKATPTPASSDAAGTATPNPASSTASSEAQTPAATETPAPSPEVTEPTATPNAEAPANSEESTATTDKVSEQATAFIEAVTAAVNKRDDILNAANAFGLASKAWQANQEDAALKETLDQRTAELDAICDWAAIEDMYMALPAEEQATEAVSSAYLQFVDLYTAAVEAQQNPVAPDGESALYDPESTQSQQVQGSAPASSYQAITPAQTGKDIAAGAGGIQYSKTGTGDNTIRITPQTVTYTYGTAYSFNGLVVEYTTTDSRDDKQVQADIQAALDGLSFIVYSLPDADGQNPTDIHCNAGTYASYVDTSTTSINVGGLNYTIIDGSNLDSSSDIRNDSGIVINKREIYVVPETTYVTKGNSLSQINYSVTDYNGGLVDGDLLPADLFSCPTFNKDQTGNYLIQLGSAASSNTNYTVKIEPETPDTYVVVSDAVLNITPVFVYTEAGGTQSTGSHVSRQYGQQNPAVDFIVTGWSSQDQQAYDNKTKNEHKSSAQAVKEILGLSGEPTALMPSITAAPGGYSVGVGNIQNDAPINGYSINLGTATMTITKRSVTISNDTIHAIYGESEKGKSSTITFNAVKANGASQAVSSEARNVSGNAIKADDGVNSLVSMIITTSRSDLENKNVGTYPMTVEVPPACTAYYDITYENANYIIHPAMLTVTLSDQSVVYGAARSGKMESVEGFQYDDSAESIGLTEDKLNYTMLNAEGESGTVQGADVGEYTISASVQGAEKMKWSTDWNPAADNKEYDVFSCANGYDNYLVRFVDATLTVTARPLTITVTPGQSKVYGDNDAPGGISFTLDNEFQNDFNGCKVIRAAGETVGSYAYSDEQFQSAAAAHNYTITFNASDEYKITKRTLTVTVPNETRLYGETNPDAAKIIGALKFDNFANNEALGIHDTVASLGGSATVKFGVDNTVGTLTGVGTYPIVVSGYESPNYTIVYAGSYSDGTSGILTINPLPVVIKGTTNSVRRYGVAGKNTPSYALYDATGSKVINVVDPEGSPLNIYIDLSKWEDPTTVVGNYEATITYDPNPNYEVTISPQATFQVTEADVSVTFNALQTTYGEKTPADLAKEVSVNVNTSDGTQIYHDGETVTIKMGDENVSLGVVRISIEGSPNASGLYDAGSYNLTFRLDNQPESSVKLSEPDGRNMLIVHQMPLTITPKYDLSKTYGESDPSFAVTEQYVTFEYNTDSHADPKADFAQATLTREAGENAGTYPIYAGTIYDQPMAKNYRISFTNDVRFTIKKATAVINLRETTKVYGETILQINVADYIQGGTGLLEGTEEQKAEKEQILKSITLVSGATSASANVGEYALKAIYSQPANYDLTVVDSTITVTPRPITLTFSNLEKVYGDADPAFKYTVEGNISADGLNRNTLELVSGALSGEVTREPGEDVGDYPIRSTLYNEHGNYTITVVTGDGLPIDLGIVSELPEATDVAKLTITPATVTFKVNGGYSMVYGGSVPEIGYTVSGLKNGDTVEDAFTGEIVYNIKGEDGELTPIPERPAAGDYVIVMSGLENAGASNYDPIVYVDGSLHVAKRDIIIAIDEGQGKVYGEADPELTWTATGDGAYYVNKEAGDLANIKVVRPDAGTDAGENVGDHELILTGDDANFNITPVTNTFKITPATLTVSLEAQSKIYGDENPVLSGDDLIFSGFVTKPVTGNETPDDESSLTITDLKFVFTDAEGATATAASHAGVGSVTASGIKNVGSENYTFSYVPAEFTINERPITVTAKPQTSIYGDEIAVKDWSDYSVVNTIAYTGDEEKAAVVNGDILEGTNICAVTSTSDVGEYDIVPSFSGMAHRMGQASYNDYEISVVNGVYTVTKRPLTWTISTVGSVYGNETHSFDNTLAYTGDAEKPTIIGDDDLKAVITISSKDSDISEEIPMISSEGATSLIASVDPTIITDFGAYDLIGSYDNGNYDVTIVNGVYTVGERLVEVTVTEPSDTIYGEMTNPDIQVKAVATNGDGTHGGAVAPDSLGLQMDLSYEPFADDVATGESAKPSTDVSATLTPDIASGEDAQETDSQFVTEGVKHAGTYTYVVTSDYDEVVEDKYAVTIKYVDADGAEADGQFIINRKDLSVAFDPNPATKQYGTETIVPDLVYSGYAFDESSDTVQAPDFQIVVLPAVTGKFGDVGLYKDAFSYAGGGFGDYNYLPATGDLEITRLSLNDVDSATISGVTVVDGKETDLSVKADADLSETWFVSKVTITAPEGYVVSDSDALTGNVWGDTMSTETNGHKVTVTYFLMNVETGAISEAGTVLTNIDTLDPVVNQAFVASSYDAEGKTDILNDQFKKFESKVTVFLGGQEVGKNADEGDTSTAETAMTFADAEQPDGFVPEVSTDGTFEGDVNSGVKAIEYYRVDGTNIAKDEDGNVTFDATKATSVDVTEVDANNGYVSFEINPDWTGYIVVRTVDVAGNYGPARAATIKLEAPKPAPQDNNNNDDSKDDAPAPTPVPNPIVVNYKTGVSLFAGIGIAVVVVVALGVVLVVVRRKAADSKKNTSDKEKTEEEKKKTEEKK